MNKTKIAFGIGIVQAVLAVLTASATAQNNMMYFDPKLWRYNSNNRNFSRILKQE